MTPLFSVLIANYNNGKYLEECLESIFAQTCKEWEIVIVDDASTDNSIDIFNKYKEDSRIRIFRNKKNRGVGYSKHKCVEHAKGELCSFVDADDALTPDALDIMVKAHLEFPSYSLIYSTHYICDEALQPQRIADYTGHIPEKVKSWSLQRPVISHFATFKRSHYLRTKGISSIFKKAADKDLYYKLEDTGPVRFIDKPLYYYRHHGNSISLNNNATIAFQYELVAKAMVIIRHHKRKETFSEMPHSKIDLSRGILKAAFFEAGRYNFYTSASLLFLFIRFSPFSIFNIVISWMSNKWSNPPH